MDIKNIERAKELIPALEALTKARNILSNADSRIDIVGKNDKETLPSIVRLNILNVVNCEYERIRKEVKEL